MSRHNYSEDCDGWDLTRWRGTVAHSIKGRRGQAFLRELAAAMDQMPAKRLIERELQNSIGEVCVLGVVCKNRGLDVSDIDIEDSESISKLVGISDAMVREMEYVNDDGNWMDETPEQRWRRMRDWVANKLITGHSSPVTSSMEP